MPYYPYHGSAASGYPYTNTSFWYKLVSEYTGLDFLRIEELNYLAYLVWRRDAYIYRLEQSEAGREYLENAWRMEQTKPDRAALREKYGGSS